MKTEKNVLSVRLFGTQIHRICAIAIAAVMGFGLAGCDNGDNAETTFTVTYNRNSNEAIGNTPAPQTVAAGSSITISGGSGLSHTGAIFIGWNTRADGTGDRHYDGSDFIPTANTTLYAEWNIGFYYVIYDANGGSGAVPSTETVSNNSSISLPGGNGLFRAGYAFVGWSNTVSSEILSAGSSVTINGHTTMYARWTVSSSNEPGDSYFSFETGMRNDGTQVITITGYSGGASNVTIPAQIDGKPVTAIGRGVFRNRSDLVGITIPDSVTSIGDSAFSGCAGLTGITIGNDVTDIGDYAFQGCENLRNVTIKTDKVTNTRSNNWGTRFPADNLAVTFQDVTRIGDRVFEGCTRLASVIIPNSVTSIGDRAFPGCTGLANVTIPNSVTSIGGGAFSGCTGLANVTIPNSVTSIGVGAFHECTGLASVTIGNGVTSIGDRAFCECTGLASVTFEGIIIASGFNIYAFFQYRTGDLRVKYLVGGIGTYTRTGGSGNYNDPYVWTKQGDTSIMALLT